MKSGLILGLLFIVCAGCHGSSAPEAASSSGASQVGTTGAPATLATAGGNHSQPASSQPADSSPVAAPQIEADGSNEMLQSKSRMAGYGAEVSRVVDRSDEIISVLRNGLVVIVRRVPSPVTAVRGYCFTGGVYEGKWLGGGLSHLLEHLVAGGSNQRRTEAENRDLLQKIGNNSNAYTSEDHTAFFINTTTDHLEQAVDLVTGWMLGASITPAEYRREYQVVQRELEMGKGEPDRQFYYLAAGNRYKVSPARVPVIGYQEVIQGLSRDDVYSYYKLAYQPNNMLFSIAGDAEPEQMLKAVQKYVSDAKPGRVFSHDIATEPRVVAPRTAVATFPKLGQAKLELGFPSVRLDDPDIYALDLLGAVTGGSEGSLLVQEIRDKQQLVSSVSVNDETPSYVAGTFTVDMELEPEKIAPATDAVLAMLDAVKEKGVDEGALARGKSEIRAARVKRLQTSEEVAASLAEDYISSGDAHFSDEYVERIAKVTNDDIKRVAKKYLDRGRLLTNAMLPTEYTGSAGLPRAVDLIRPVASSQPSTEPTTQPAGGASAVVRAELENGSVLLLKKITTSPLVVIQSYALGGVTAEDAKTNGLGNMAMQLLMRGTTTRSALEIANFFSSTGGEMTASSGNNTWSWNATCLKENLEKTLEVYSDILNHPAFADAEVGQMKHRVLAGIAGEDADWTQQALHYFKKQYFGPESSPYQFTAQGSAANVQLFTAGQIRDWYEKHVLSGKRVIAIFGDIDLDKAKALAAELLGKGPKLQAAPQVANAPVKQVTVSAASSINVERVAVQKTDQALAGVVIGFRSNSVIGDSRQFALAVAQTIAGGYTFPTGYLFETLRGRGLVYVVEAVNNPGRGPATPGTFLVLAGCDPSKVNEVVETSLENIAREQGTAADINEQWFGRSKELIALADALEHETPTEQAVTASLDELFGLGYDYHRSFAQRIRDVSLPEVQQTARELLNSCVVTISTPAPELVKIDPGRRNYQTFPPVELTPRGIQHDTGGGAK